MYEKYNVFLIYSWCLSYYKLYHKNTIIKQLFIGFLAIFRFSSLTYSNTIYYSFYCKEKNKNPMLS